MKRIVLILFILLSLLPAGYSQVSVISYTAATCGVGGCTSPTLNTTSATCIVVGITAGSTISAPTDSKTNTWILDRTENSGGVGARQSVWHCESCIVGTNHTFTSPATTTNIHILAVSGTRTTGTLDQQNGANTQASGSVASGSITPSVNGCLVFYQGGFFNPGSSPTLTSGGGTFTLLRAVGTGTSHAGGAWYEIQTTATARNVTGSSTSSPHATGIILSFLPPAVAPTDNNNFLLSEW